MPAFTSHLFICGNQRPANSPRGCCNPDGTDALRAAFKAALKARGLDKPGAGALVRANGAGCLEQCEVGPVVVIYPQGIWYGGVQLDDVDRIVDETIVGGRVLDDLLIPNELLNCRELAAKATKEPGTPFRW
jgi:(2Fe-2S) ferredoxin